MNGKMTEKVENIGDTRTPSEDVAPLNACETGARKRYGIFGSAKLED